MEKASGLRGLIRNIFGGGQSSAPSEPAQPAGLSREEIFEAVREAGRKAREASRAMAAASPAAKNLALETLASLIESRADEIMAANAEDLAAAEAAGIDAPRMDRLRLTPAILADMAGACRYVAQLPDPVGAMDSQWQRPNGILVGRMRVPLGVLTAQEPPAPSTKAPSSKPWPILRMML